MHTLTLGTLVILSLGRPAIATEVGWSVEGSWVDTCSCAIPCPCWKKELPTLGHCSEMFYFHVDKGHYGPVRLDGVELIQIASSGEGKTTSASRKARDYTISNLYVSNTLSPSVVDAVEKIFFRLAFSGPIAHKFATKRVALHAVLAPDHLRADIPGILVVDVIEQKDGAGHPKPFVYPTTNMPWLGPGNQGESIEFTFHDDGAAWRFSHRQGTFAHFAYSSDRGPLPWETPTSATTPR